jgi:hypothetical protein
LFGSDLLHPHRSGDKWGAFQCHGDGDDSSGNVQLARLLVRVGGLAAPPASPAAR